MKFMKLGNRPDSFFATEAIRSVSSEVSTDLEIHVHGSLYRLHKFPLLSKCLRLQQLCSEIEEDGEVAVVRLPDFVCGADAFELCAKFCYGIAITLSALNIVPVWCAAHYLRMSDDADRGNLIGKLEVFFRSCILRRWKDTLVALQSTRQHAPPLCEELGITGRCVDAIATAVISHPLLPGASGSWWDDDLAELCIDHYWRVMVAVKSAGIVPAKLVGEALRVYALRWLSIHDDGREVTAKQKLVMEKIVSLLPQEKGSVSCNFLLKLLKAANFLQASTSLKLELARRVGSQLEEATADDLLIPSDSGDTLYDVDMVMTMLEEFLLQVQSPATTPPREKLKRERRRSQSAEKAEFEGRRSSSASHSSKLRVAKLIDGYLQEIASDINLSMEKLIAVAEAVPDFARVDHDDLYRVIDTYLRSHPELDKNARKQLCRMLDCKKLSVEVCMEAAQNELLPLRVVVQVLFSEQSRAAAALSGCQVTELPSNLKTLLATTAAEDEDNEAAPPPDGDWSISKSKCPTAKLETLKMKLAQEHDDEIDYDPIPREALLLRSASSRLRALCSLPKKSKRIISKLLAMNRRASEKH
ncbi:BTB/POZ domain-containing protein At1g67900-like [Curcuma longa]|uniref:BTB/POZ domain-containing protein At1g67900-like n=1 Tax=Curcuma longa TaxID=136217 RepID=UPI003D9E9EDB